MSDSLRPHGLYSSWNFPGQNTGVGSLSLLQGILPTQGFNPGLLHCRWILYQLSHQGSPKNTEGNNKSDWCLWACVDFFFSFYFLVVSKFSIKNTFSISRYYFHIGKNTCWISALLSVASLLIWHTLISNLTAVSTYWYSSFLPALPNKEEPFSTQKPTWFLKNRNYIPLEPFGRFPLHAEENLVS